MQAEAKLAQKPSLTIRRHFNASPSKLYAAWTDPKQIAKWMGPEGIDALHSEADPRVGKHIEMFHDRRQRHRKRPRQLAHRKSRIRLEPRQQRPPRGVGERSEGAVEFGVLKLNHWVKY